jgi:hypothetical protein
MDYDIDTMIKTFEDHSKENQVRRVKEIEQFPDSEWLKNDFCISKALLEMCKMIKDLKNEN